MAAGPVENKVSDGYAERNLGTDIAMHVTQVWPAAWREGRQART